MSAFVELQGRSAPDGAYICQSVVDGKLVWGYRHRSYCPACNEAGEQSFLEEYSNLAGSDLMIRLDQFQALQGKAAARTRAGAIMAMTPQPVGFVTFYGAYGVGKSMLLKALINQFRVARVRSRYTTMTDLLAEVRSMFGDQARDAAETLIARYRTTPVLAIDEVDRIQKTEWSLDVVFRLLNERYEHREGCLTLLATNSDPASMPPEMAYLSSRMLEDTVLIGGKDMRRK